MQAQQVAAITARIPSTSRIQKVGEGRHWPEVFLTMLSTRSLTPLLLLLSPTVLVRAFPNELSQMESGPHDFKSPIPVQLAPQKLSPAASVVWRKAMARQVRRSSLTALMVGLGTEHGLDLQSARKRLTR